MADFGLKVTSVWEGQVGYYKTFEEIWQLKNLTSSKDVMNAHDRAIDQVR